MTAPSTNSSAWRWFDDHDEWRAPGAHDDYSVQLDADGHDEPTVIIEDGPAVAEAPAAIVIKALHHVLVDAGWTPPKDIEAAPCPGCAICNGDTTP